MSVLSLAAPRSEAQPESSARQPLPNAEPTPSASTNSTPRRVYVTVDASCTNEEDFGRRLSERTPRIVRVTEAEAGTADRVDVRIRAEGPKSFGSFVVTRTNEPTRSRQVEGRSCDEVADVLSLALALAYDRETAPPPASSPPLPVEPSTSTAAPPARKKDRGAAPLCPPVPPPSKWFWRAGVSATVAATKTWPVGGEFFVDLAHEVAPSFRLGFEVRYANTEVTPASVDLLWTFATPSICPVHLRSGPFDVAPCGGMTLGALSATTNGLPDTRSEVRAWIAPRLSGFASFRLTDWMALDARASLEVPLVRSSYEFGDIVAYEVPMAMPSFGFGATFASTKPQK